MGQAHILSTKGGLKGQTVSCKLSIGDLTVLERIFLSVEIPVGPKV